MQNLPHEPQPNAEQAPPDLLSIGIIVNHDMGSRVVRKAKDLGATRATIQLARGTVSSRLLDLLGIEDIRRELIWLVAPRAKALRLMGDLAKHFQFNKANHGIIFAMQIKQVIASHVLQQPAGAQTEASIPQGDKTMNYQLITVIVDHGRGEAVVTAAKTAGAPGATLLSARGTSVHEHEKVFGMEIEPEKDMVLFLVPQERTEAIISAVSRELDIEKPGRGIIFVEDVVHQLGVREDTD